ncbi:MAG TPA: TraR/DksA family transcriptional regulator [Actinomycetota bacterium]|nr:TraR/DksA family transcriptional regulator [Actinomycetota bacterium]
MDQATLDRLRDQLSDERNNLMTQLVDMGVDPKTGTPDEMQFEQGFADSGQATADKARLLSIAEGLVGMLQEVDAALERMNNGTYGRCESCGAEIPPERLDARPVANLCVECKKRHG